MDAQYKLFTQVHVCPFQFNCLFRFSCVPKEQRTYCTDNTMVCGIKAVIKLNASETRYRSAERNMHYDGYVFYIVIL